MKLGDGKFASGDIHIGNADSIAANDDTREKIIAFGSQHRRDR